MNIKLTIKILFLVGSFFIYGFPAYAVVDTGIIINEVFYDAEGSDTGKEFIELYNQGNEPVDMTGWNLDPSSAPYYTLPSFTIAPRAYAVIHINTEGINTATDLYTGPLSNMSNTKGPVALFSSTTHTADNLIAYLAYGASGQTNESKAMERGIWTTGDFITDVQEGASIAFDGSGTTSADWLVATPTPGRTNIPFFKSPPNKEIPKQENQTPQQTPSAPTRTSAQTERATAGSVVINEFVADPTDYEDEWIELYNTTGAPINMDDWFIEEGAGSVTELTGIIGPFDFYVITKPKGRLNNTGDIIILKDATAKMIDSVTYGAWDDGVLEDNAPKANDPYSVARIRDGFTTENDAADFAETTTPTKGRQNAITTQISDIKKTSVAQSKQNNGAIPAQTKNSSPQNNRPPVALFETEEIVLVGAPITFDASESYDPDGDTLSYIWNFGNSDGLAGFTTSYRYLIPRIYTVTLTVNDGEYESKEERSITIVAKRDELPLTPERIMSEKKVILSEALPNPVGTDSELEWVELMNTAQQTIDVSGWYLDDSEGGSKPYKLPKGTTIKANGFLVLERDETKVAFNNTLDEVRLLSPNKKIIDAVSYDNVIEGFSYARSDNGWGWTAQPTPAQKNIFIASYKNKLFPQTLELALSDIHELVSNTDVTTRGIVTVPPHTFAKTYFYITSLVPDKQNLTRGIQIYMNHADWPELSVGDVIELTGKLQVSTIERRIKLSNNGDIKIIGKDTVLAPTLIDIEEIDDAIVGSLITISGQLIETNGQNYYIDDSTGELRVYMNSGTDIKTNGLVEGSYYEISGILSKTKSGIRLLPRNNDDIIRTKVLGASETTEAPPLTTEDSRRRALQYLIATVIALIVLFIGLSLKIRKKNREIENVEREL